MAFHDHWMSLWNTNPDRQRNKHWHIACDRDGYPRWIKLNNRSYHANQTKHGKDPTDA